MGIRTGARGDSERVVRQLSGRNSTSLGAGGSSAAGNSGAVFGGGTTAIGQSNTAGGNSAAGGGAATGGAATGGAATSGGKSSLGGGAATGGVATTGGRSSTGGSVSTGGKSSTGGMTAAGGQSTNTGGSSSAGGSSSVNCSGTAGSSSCPDGVTGMCGMLAAQNAVRAAAPGASPALPPLLWDCTLAAFAQAWADTCPSDHNPNRTVEGATAGENIYWYGGNTLQSPSAAVNAWASEGPPNYVYSTNYCYGAPYTSTNFQCGHYTQIVWRTTTRVGCGYKTGCSGTYAQVWVCDYLPAGNYYNSSTGAINLPY